MKRIKTFHTAYILLSLLLINFIYFFLIQVTYVFFQVSVLSRTVCVCVSVCGYGLRAALFPLS